MSAVAGTGHEIAVLRRQTALEARVAGVILAAHLLDKVEVKRHFGDLIQQMKQLPAASGSVSLVEHRGEEPLLLAASKHRWIKANRAGAPVVP